MRSLQSHGLWGILITCLLRSVPSSLLLHRFLCKPSGHCGTTAQVEILVLSLTSSVTYSNSVDFSRILFYSGDRGILTSPQFFRGTKKLSEERYIECLAQWWSYKGDLCLRPCISHVLKIYLMCIVCTSSCTVCTMAHWLSVAWHFLPLRKYFLCLVKKLNITMKVY